MARLGTRITKLKATRPNWRAFRLDPETLSPRADKGLAAAQGPDGLKMGKLSTADLEALVALGEDMAL